MPKLTMTLESTCPSCGTLNEAPVEWDENDAPPELTLTTCAHCCGEYEFDMDGVARA